MVQLEGPWCCALMLYSVLFSPFFRYQTSLAFRVYSPQSPFSDYFHYDISDTFERFLWPWITSTTVLTTAISITRHYPILALSCVKYIHRRLGQPRFPKIAPIACSIAILYSHTDPCSMSPRDVVYVTTTTGNLRSARRKVFMSRQNSCPSVFVNSDFSVSPVSKI